MRRLASFPRFEEGGHPTLPVTHEGLLSIDGLRDVEHFHALMDRLCGQAWAFEYSPREARQALAGDSLPAGIQLHLWAGSVAAAPTTKPVEGDGQAYWRVKSWSPSLIPAEELVGKTGTVVTLDSDPSWPHFEVYGLLSGETDGPVTTGVFESTFAHGRWTVEAVEYIAAISALNDKPLLVTVGLLLKAADHG